MKKPINSFVENMIIYESTVRVSLFGRYIAFPICTHTHLHNFGYMGFLLFGGLYESHTRGVVVLDFSRLRHTCFVVGQPNSAPRQ